MLGLPESSDVEDFIYYDLGRQSYVLASDIEDVGEMSKEEFETRKENAAFIEKDNYLLQRLSAI